MNEEEESKFPSRRIPAKPSDGSTRLLLKVEQISAGTGRVSFFLKRERGSV